MNKQILIALFFIILLTSCAKKHEVIRSFCYWKTSLYNGEKDDSLLSAMKVKHLYVRYFDVDWDAYRKEARPVATVSNISFSNSNPNITPAIFITNDVLLQANRKQLDSLAIRIGRRVNLINQKYFKHQSERNAQITASKFAELHNGITLNADSIAATNVLDLRKTISEILLDCDWSEKSQGNYFYLLRQIKKQFPDYKIAATIRLWQYKYYEKAGIPPVDRGLLMCYNMTSPDEHTSENSIGSEKELRKYLTHDDYKLPLDIALPIFSWSVIFRGNKFKGILNDEIKTEKDTSLFRKVNDNRFVLQDDIMLFENYLRNGDEIRVEKISDLELRKMIANIKDKIKVNGETKVTLFSFDEKFINNYGTEKISDYYSLF